MTRTEKFAAIPLLSLLLFSQGCAVPGEPQPPLLEIPAPVRDLTAVQVGNRIELKWSPVQQTTEGTLATKLDRLEFYAAFLPAASPLADFASQAEQIGTFRNFYHEGVPMIALRGGHIVEIHGSQAGQQAYLALKAINQRGVDAGYSNVVLVDILDLPEPPEDLSSTVTEQAITLTWKPARRSVFAGEAPLADGYEILRSTVGSNEAETLLGTSPTESYADRAFEFGTRYSYSVRAFALGPASKSITPASMNIEVLALDRFAPAPPVDLRAIAVTGAVELAWSPNTEADLAGYNIYREPLDEDGRGSAPRRRLNGAPLDVPLYRDLFSDAGARPASRFRYTATAVDRDGNESAASNEETVETE